mgnify:FL=1
MSDKEIFDSVSMFANTFSFLGLPISRDIDTADLVVMGIPYDLATTGRAGTRHGPQAVRRASANLRWEEKRWPWSFTATDRLNVIDYGDIEFNPGDCPDAESSIIDHVGRVHNKQKKTLCFGGDHFVTLPQLRAVHQNRGTVALVQFDAHTDTYEESSEYDHGGMFYAAPKENLIDPSHSIQIGIRTEYESDPDIRVIDAAKANDMACDDIVAAIKDRVGDMPIYLTFDIDCLDPAYAPGTGTPVVGGMSTDKVLKILRGLAGINIVAADVVEVAPAYDHADITALAGATIGLEIMYLMASCED